ncbi:hypothetical protein FHN55_10010 [Streptomyces sp. NP160]|uniref:hypothetical protein n=1 Tax=Streptomyces sp. NP160 TaxID=2586637 RepID=UPI0011190902|nr:hypothetical protein [Streptomyces sp. NP160]TNM67737.1 hypothetical protein FHN55_10010 [Streptomyces sp. NP160]
MDDDPPQLPPTPRPPLDALDFPVAVPADLPLAAVAVVGWGRSGGQDGAVLWGDVEVAPQLRTDQAEDGEPQWRLQTRPRRGVRPAGPPGAGLLVDPDIATLAADAVHRLLSSRIPPGLEAPEAQRRVRACWQRSQELRVAFHPLPAAGAEWQRRDVLVDGQRYAMWVHEDETGWAGAADLGAVYAVATGLGGAPVSWSSGCCPTRRPWSCSPGPERARWSRGGRPQEPRTTTSVLHAPAGSVCSAQ